MRTSTAVAPVLSLMIFSAAMAQVQPTSGSTADPWAGWRFVLGEWVGEGSGGPGEGSGSFSFRFDLDGKILVRRNHAEYPPSGGKPAVLHDDLMVCYPDPAGDRILAIYFDNEGHVIHYAAETDGVGRLVLASEVTPSAPRFRLTYTKQAGDTVGIKFEIAPPGRTDFVSYLSGKATRVTKP